LSGFELANSFGVLEGRPRTERLVQVKLLSRFDTENLNVQWQVNVILNLSFVFFHFALKSASEVLRFVSENDHLFCGLIVAYLEP